MGRTLTLDALLADPTRVGQVGSEDLEVLYAIRDEARSEVLHLQDVVRGTIAADADPAMDDSWLAPRIEAQLESIEDHLDGLRQTWREADADRTAVLAEARADQRRAAGLADELAYARSCKSAFYRADERFEADAEPDWDEVDSPQWAGDVTEWRKDLASAPLTVEEFGKMSRTPIWAESVPVANPEAVPHLARHARLCDALTERIAELEAVQLSGGRLTVEQLERPVARMRADGTVDVDCPALLAAPGTIAA